MKCSIYDAFHLGLHCLLGFPENNELNRQWCRYIMLDVPFHSGQVKNFYLQRLFDLILYIPVNNFSVMSGQVFLG